MIRLLQGDCLTMLKEVAPASVDLVLCDPPYSSGGTHAGDRKASTTAKYTDRDYDGAAKLPAFSGDTLDDYPNPYTGETYRTLHGLHALGVQ